LAEVAEIPEAEVHGPTKELNADSNTTKVAGATQFGTDPVYKVGQ
jgi:hypothetical protein